MQYTNIAIIIILYIEKDKSAIIVTKITTTQFPAIVLNSWLWTVQHSTNNNVPTVCHTL